MFAGGIRGGGVARNVARSGVVKVAGCGMEGGGFSVWDAGYSSRIPCLRVTGDQVSIDQDTRS